MEINYTASPTASRFHNSKKIVRGFRGPVGNGKSVCCIQEGIRLSTEQWPNSAGIRKSRGVIVRNTGPELRTTTLKTWKQWMPEEICPVVMAPVIVAMFKQKLSDGTIMEMEVFFLAMDRDKDVKKLLSLETSWVFLNEAKELPYAVVKAARERVGRYPSKVDGYEDVYKDDELIYEAPRDEDGRYKPCRRKAVIMDTNPPDDDHWWYQLAEEGCLRKAADDPLQKKLTGEVFDFFAGPSPLIKQADGSYTPNPEAENIDNLDGGYKYYLDMIGGSTKEHINVMVMGNYGSIAEGRLVYTAYNDDVHCPGIVPPDPTLPIGIGWDFGLTPCIVIGQLTSSGQFRVIDELVSDDMDVRTFARDGVKPFLKRKYPDYVIAFSIADPAGNARGEGEGKASIGILNDEYLENDAGDIIVALDMGFETIEAPTNDPTRRIDAVSQSMTVLIDGEPGYLLSSACFVLRKGKQGGYCHQRVAVTGKEEVFRDKPNKNKYSHSADAEQYLKLGFDRGYAVEDDEPLELNFAGWSR